MFKMRLDINVLHGRMQCDEGMGDITLGSSQFDAPSGSAVSFLYFVRFYVQEAV